MAQQNLSGKLALVTGASAGIGEATARRLSAEGARVVLAARRRDRLESIASELPDAQVLELDSYPNDLGDHIREQILRTKERPLKMWEIKFAAVCLVALALFLIASAILVATNFSDISQMAGELPNYIRVSVPVVYMLICLGGLGLPIEHEATSEGVGLQDIHLLVGRLAGE